MPEVLIIITLSCAAGVMMATIASAGIYYAYRGKKDKKKEKRQAITSTPALTYDDPQLVYHDEALVDLESVPVQPQTRRPIRSPDDVYPPLKDEEQDDYLLENLDMVDLTPGAMPSVSPRTRARERREKYINK